MFKIVQDCHSLELIGNTCSVNMNKETIYLIDLMPYCQSSCNEVEPIGLIECG